jgi:hypothetical protein
MHSIEIEIPIYDKEGQVTSNEKKFLKDLDIPKTQYEIRLKYGDTIAEMFEYQYYLAYTVDDYKDFPKRGIASTLSLIKVRTIIATLPPEHLRTDDFWKKSGLLPLKE